MEFLTLWIAFAVIGIVATISPGPAFAMTVRIAVSNSRKVGIIFALGLGAGIAVQVSSILLGMGVIIAQSVFLFNLIKYAGAAYLIYIGIKGLRSRKKETLGVKDAAIKKDLTPTAAFRQGLITNVLNPKAVVFFTAVFAQFISPETTALQKIALGSTSVCIEAGGFARAVGAQQRDSLATLNMQAHIAQHGAALIALGDVLDHEAFGHFLEMWMVGNVHVFLDLTYRQLYTKCD